MKDINKVERKWNILGFVDDNLNSLDGFKCSHSVVGTIKEWHPMQNQEFACAIANPQIKKFRLAVL